LCSPRVDEIEPIGELVPPLPGVAPKGEVLESLADVQHVVALGGVLFVFAVGWLLCADVVRADPVVYAEGLLER
jgi:hypothetical protein